MLRKLISLGALKATRTLACPFGSRRYERSLGVGAAKLEPVPMLNASSDSVQGEGFTRNENGNVFPIRNCIYIICVQHMHTKLQNQ